MTPYEIISCNLEEHGAQVLEILNEVIVNSTALYDYEPRPLESMDGWFANKETENFPVIGLVDGNQKLVGFASFGVFRAYPAFHLTVEHSIYVHKDFRGQGLAKVLLEKIIEEARHRGLHAMVGAIDASNQASISLHEQFGFRHVGTLPEVGFKFDKWLDLVFYQLLLE
ncbi:MAG: hypothetical protein RLY13_469 [Actinomycetota bacterium]|jgi:phosphinothricin acetyltransferase